MKPLLNETISESMEPFYGNDSTRLFYNTELRVGICEVTAPYQGNRV